MPRLLVGLLAAVSFSGGAAQTCDYVDASNLTDINAQVDENGTLAVTASPGFDLSGVTCECQETLLGIVPPVTEPNCTDPDATPAKKAEDKQLDADTDDENDADTIVVTIGNLQVTYSQSTTCQTVEGAMINTIANVTEQDANNINITSCQSSKKKTNGNDKNLDPGVMGEDEVLSEVWEGWEGPDSKAVAVTKQSSDVSADFVMRVPTSEADADQVANTISAGLGDVNALTSALNGELAAANIPASVLSLTAEANITTDRICTDSPLDQFTPSDFISCANNQTIVNLDGLAGYLQAGGELFGGKAGFASVPLLEAIEDAVEDAAIGDGITGQVVVESDCLNATDVSAAFLTAMNQLANASAATAIGVEDVVFAEVACAGGPMTCETAVGCPGPTAAPTPTQVPTPTVDPACVGGPMTCGHSMGMSSMMMATSMGGGSGIASCQLTASYNFTVSPCAADLFAGTGSGAGSVGGCNGGPMTCGKGASMGMDMRSLKMHSTMMDDQEDEETLLDLINANLVGCSASSVTIYDLTECPIPGCMHVNASNYDPAATVNDSDSCTFVTGCTSTWAENYDPDALVSDVLNPGHDSSANLSGLCEYAGCTDPTAACDYYWAGYTVDDGSCRYTDGCTDALANNYDPSADCWTSPDPCRYDGCTDAAATNYDPSADDDDGTCVYPGPITGQVVVESDCQAGDMSVAFAAVMQELAGAPATLDANDTAFADVPCNGGPMTCETAVSCAGPTPTAVPTPTLDSSCVGGPMTCGGGMMSMGMSMGAGGGFTVCQLTSTFNFSVPGCTANLFDLNGGAPCTGGPMTCGSGVAGGQTDEETLLNLINANITGCSATSVAIFDLMDCYTPTPTPLPTPTCIGGPMTCGHDGMSMMGMAAADDAADPFDDAPSTTSVGTDDTPATSGEEGDSVLTKHKGVPAVGAAAVLGAAAAAAVLLARRRMVSNGQQILTDRVQPLQIDMISPQRTDTRPATSTTADNDFAAKKRRFRELNARPEALTEAEAAERKRLKKELKRLLNADYNPMGRAHLNPSAFPAGETIM